MDWLIYILQTFWLEILIVVIGVAVVHMARMTIAAPVARAVPEDELTQDFRDAIAQHDSTIRELGFTWLGDFDVSVIEGVLVLVRIYVAGDRTCMASLEQATAVGNLPPATVVEFTTELMPHGCIETSNVKTPESTAKPADMFCARVPEESVRKMWVLHQELCSTAESERFEPVEYPAGQPENNIAEMLKHSMTRELELQVKKRRAKRLPDGSCRLTLLGAMLGVPQQALLMFWGALPRFHSLNTASLCVRLARRLKRARNMPERLRSYPFKTNDNHQG